MIAAIEWVPAGVAAEAPKKYEMNAAEKDVLEMLQKQQQEEEEQGEAGPTKSSVSSRLPKIEASELPADLRMDEYCDDEQEGAALGNLLVEQEGQEIMEDVEDADAKTDGNIGDANDDMDSSDDENEIEDNLEDVPDTREYTPIDVEGLEAMGLGEGAAGEDRHRLFVEDDSDAEEVRISKHDAVLVVAKTEDDFASLEVNIYDTRQGNLYIHHDIPLPSFPLCLARGSVGGDGSTNGNFCAVGTFDPGIEIWNMDVINALEPTSVLGGADTTIADDVMKQNLLAASSGQQLKRTYKAGDDDGTLLRAGSHTGAVMGLSWNEVHGHVIASGSADNTVKIWDVSMAGTDKANAATFKHHRDKVQSVQWHPQEATILATGSYDRTVALVDARDSAGSNIKKAKIPADCEALAWDPFHPELLTAACEDGTVMCWDVRKFSDKTPMWSFVANEFGGISDLSYNRHVPGMLATAAIDKTIALWDTYSQNDAPQANAPPRACGSKDMKAGKLYTVGFYPSLPWLMGCGGSGNQLALWDMSCEAAIQNRFGKRMEGWTPPESTEGDGKETDFEAAMAKEEESSSKKTNKKKKGKGKNKKAHRRGR